MSETLLAIIFFTVIISLRFLITRIPQPTRLYITMVFGILLLVLVWFFAGDTKTTLQILMTVLVLSSWYRAYLDYRQAGETSKMSNDSQRSDGG